VVADSSDLACPTTAVGVTSWWSNRGRSEREKWYRDCLPCTQLAWDYLNVFRLDDRHVGLCVLDVSGRGRGAVVGHGRPPAPGAGTALVPPAEIAARLDRELKLGDCRARVHPPLRHARARHGRVAVCIRRPPRPDPPHRRGVAGATGSDRIPSRGRRVQGASGSCGRGTESNSSRARPANRVTAPHSRGSDARVVNLETAAARTRRGSRWAILPGTSHEATSSSPTSRCFAIHTAVSRSARILWRTGRPHPTSFSDRPRRVGRHQPPATKVAGRRTRGRSV
jgi:hypothetical protein